MKIYFAKWLAFYLGCLACYSLQTQFGMSAVLSSSLLGFICTFLPLPDSFNRKGIHSAFFAGTFAGMCSVQILSNQWHILIVSFLGAVVYFLMKPVWIGFGGKMGMVAFLSSLLLILFRVFV